MLVDIRVFGGFTVSIGVVDGREGGGVVKSRSKINIRFKKK